MSSTKDLKNSRAFQNTTAGTSENDSHYKGLTPVSVGTRNTMTIRAQRANFVMKNERHVVSGDRQNRIKPSESMPDSHHSQRTNVRSFKSTSNRSQKHSMKSFNSKRSNLNTCTNNFVVVGGGTFDMIDINLPNSRQRI